MDKQSESSGDAYKTKDSTGDEGKASLSPLSEFLGKPIEICIVTSSHKPTLRALTALGIGPWRIYTCSPTNTTEQTYRGRPSSFALRFCYADLPGGMTYEVINPVSRPSVFAEFLSGLAAAGSQKNASTSTGGEEGGDDSGAGGHVEGLHHIAYDCNNIPMAQRFAGFAERGYECVQSGVWHVGAAFAFFERKGGQSRGGGPWWETIAVPREEEGWVWPAAEGMFP